MIFPRGFLWGTATSSHQVEGQNTNNDWALWEDQPGRIAQAGRAGRATDWWAGRWQEDLDRAAAGHQTAHRLSLEWSRLEPRPGEWDTKALDKYRTILGGLRQRDLEPMVTLHHFTNPQWLMEQGGWLAEDVPRQFASYAARVVDEIGDLVAHWVTVNEPNVYAYMAHLAGDFPPGGRSLSDALRAMENMVRAHAASYRAIHERQPNALVGLAHHYRGMEPANPLNPLDRLFASLRSSLFNLTVPETCATGVFSLPWRRIQLPEAKGTQDFFGLNYYTREKVGFHWREMAKAHFPDGADVSPTGFIARDAEGFWQALRWAQGYGLPLYVTENGVDDPEDDLRRRYLVSHLQRLWKAANFNWQVKGYFHWSLVDSFEWERGWTQRFGLWELNTENQERTRRPSADLYSEICQSNSLTTEMVSQYAPEVFDDMFPEEPPGELGI